MKKQLLKLFNEAGFHQPEMERLSVEHKFEKFAELIVRESIKVMVKNDYHGEWLGEKVKEHFGVER
jgi:hypothetical protein